MGSRRSTTFARAEPLGTAGFLGLLDDLDEDRVLVVNGDTITDLDMGAVYREHESGGRRDDLHERADCRCRLRRGAYRSRRPDGGLRRETRAPLRGQHGRQRPLRLGDRALCPGVYAPRHARPAARDGRASATVRVRRTDAYWLDIGRMSDLEAAVEVFARDPSRFLP